MSLAAELNDLLSQERAEVEAVESLLEQMSRNDPDLARGIAGLLESSRWASSGIYHTLLRLDVIPAMDAADLSASMERQRELPGKLEVLCRHQRKLDRLAKRLLEDDGLDEPARQLLEEISGIHKRGRDWLVGAIEEWRPRR